MICLGSEINAATGILKIPVEKIFKLNNSVKIELLKCIQQESYYKN